MKGGEKGIDTKGEKPRRKIEGIVIAGKLL